MKPHQITAQLSGLVLVGLIAVVGVQHRQITRQQNESGGWERTIEAVAPESRSLTVLPAQVPLTDAELRELLILRRDVAQLRQEKPKLAILQAENARLKSALTNAASSTDRVAVPEGYIIASHARFVGFATPADTLQSFLWSIRNRDTNALFQVLTSDGVELLRRQGADGLFEGASQLPGFLIKSVNENTDGTASAEVQFDPNNAKVVEKFPLERDGHGAWRLKIF